jgi:DNA-binding NarL/FixJ family response regulator
MIIAARKLLLLLVEDLPSWQRALQRALGSEYLIKVAFSKAEAENSLDVLLELGAPPAVCVLDPTIPESPRSLEDEARPSCEGPQYEVGEDFARRLEDLSIPFVIVTGHAGPVRTVRAYEEFGASGVFRKQDWPDNKKDFLSRVRELAARASVVEVSKGKSEEPSAQVKLKGALWPFFWALVGFPLVVFAILTGVVLLIPQSLVIAVIGAGITLVALLVVSLALFTRRVTGEEFTDIIKELLKRK